MKLKGGKLNRGEKGMKRGIVLFIAAMLLLTGFSIAVYADEINKEDIGLDSDLEKQITQKATIIPVARSVLNAEQITIDDPEPGFLYFLNNGKKELPLMTNLGYSIVVYETLKIYATANGADHVKFILTRLFSTEETIVWDYDINDGFSSEFNKPSGRYSIVAVAFDAEENILSSVKTNIFYLKFGHGSSDDFGVWIRTKYNGATHAKKLGIGLLDFLDMVETGSSKQYLMTMRDKDDTVVDLSFSKTQIILASGDSVDVVQAQLNVDTSCDTTEDYETALEVRFPFSALKGESQPFSSGEPYFSARVGYMSAENEKGPANVHMRFFFGKESIHDPVVFRMKITPDNLDDQTRLTYFNSFSTQYSTGEEVFFRQFSVEFDPAVELQMTSIPGEGKIRYDFGDSANVKTKVSFNAEGGVLDAIRQSFIVDPLPSSMSFDLTLLGEKEFLYESDQSFDVTYALDSEVSGELVRLELDDLPMRVHAQRDVVKSGVLSASGFVELDMSSDVSGVSLAFLGSETPFIEVSNFPKNLRLDGFVDVENLEGSIEFSKNYDTVPEVTTTVSFDKWVISDTVELTNKYIRLFCDLGSSVSLGVDTDEPVIIRNNQFSVFDRESDLNVFSMNFEELETNDFKVSWDNDGFGGISNFEWFGGLKRLEGLAISVDQNGGLFAIAGSWNLLQNGSFTLGLNRDVNVSFDGIENDIFRISGYVDVAAGRQIHLGWDWRDDGFFVVESVGGFFGRQAGVIFECIFDSDSMEYLYGVHVKAVNFPDKYRKVWWDNQNGLHVWITGGLLPDNWEIDVKVDGTWYGQESFEYV